MKEQQTIYGKSDQEMDLSVVLRCGRDRAGLIRCLDSITEPVEVVVSLADDASFLAEVEDHGFITAPHHYGNWSIAAESGLITATNNDLIIMDSDSTFGEGSIRRLDHALKDGHVVVQPRVIFRTDGSMMSTIVSNCRTFENRYIPKSYSPGLGIKRKELRDQLNTNGFIYNPNVLFGDDGYLDQKTKEKGINTFVAEDALIYHDPIPWEYELKAANRFGRGERQLEERASGLKKQAEYMLFSPEARKYLHDTYNQYGLANLAFLLLWRSSYLAGYTMENQKLSKSNVT